MSSNKYRNKLEQLKGRRGAVLAVIDSLNQKLEALRESRTTHEEAKEFIKAVGLRTQQQITYNINEITTMALDSVLDEPYELNLEFVERRNKTECDISFIRDNIRIHPFQGGGGAVDVASFALRVAAWSMQSPKTRNTLILDEPFKHLKGEETNRKMLEMLKQISTKLGIQIIMVSDERVSREATVSVTDRLIETSINRGKTKIK